MRVCILGCWLLLSVLVAPGRSQDGPKPAESEATPAPAAEAAPQPETATASQRTSLNLLGQTDTERGESRRNENVQFNLIDNNALKELNVRIGATATIVNEFRIEQGFFGAEFGSPPTRAVHVPASRDSGVHGNLFWNHNNSVFTARAFFQVGDVRPARENQYGGRITVPLWKGGYFTGSGSQNKIRGAVNGNVLIPLPEERVPLTTDPELLPIVERILGAYPNEPPNRPDIADRALNTNSPQIIDTDSVSGQIDQQVSQRDKLVFRYAFTGQSVKAFQFVTGQNPNTDIKNHSARTTWNRAWDPNTVSDVTVGFDRLGSLLQPAPDAIGPIMSGNALTTLGPAPFIPIDRVLNRYRIAAQVRRTMGPHVLTTGFALTRLQYNGEETDGHRGILSFNDDFGRDAITNIRLGTPSSLIQAIGTTYRGYRNYNGSFYIGDKWSATGSLTLEFGLRYEPFSRPHDVTGRSDLPFSGDWDNWGPRFGLAYRLPGRWGVLRAGYALLYGQVFPVTYGHERLNPPNSVRVFVPAPDLRDPLGDIDPDDVDPNIRSSWVIPSAELSTPYSHQYNFSWELDLSSDWSLQLGYVGSRSHKLFLTYFQNRARFVEGIPYTSRTINQRRPDPTIFNRLFIHNGSRAYYDAARVTLVAPQWQGLSLNVSYWFSKALDLGGNYTNTASPIDARNAVSQFEDVSHPDLKGLSNFDQPHALLIQASYELPRLSSSARPVRAVFGGWNLSGVGLAKTGTPFTVESGSDAPGVGNVDGNRNDRPMVLNPSILGRTIGHPDRAPSLLPRSAFRFIEAPREFVGNIGRNTFRKGRIANLNLALWKEWVLPTEWRLMLRGEAVNLTNTPQFAEPGNRLTAPNFGQINNTLNDGRTFRFLLRLSF